MQSDEIDRLKRTIITQASSGAQDLSKLLQGGPSSAGASSSNSAGGGGDLAHNSDQARLCYLKRLELIKTVDVGSELSSRDKYCRVMAYNDMHAMLVVSQPSFTALAPGYGIR